MSNSFGRSPYEELDPFSWQLDGAAAAVHTPAPRSPRLAQLSPQPAQARPSWTYLVLVLHFVLLCISSRLVRYAALLPRGQALLLPAGESVCLVGVGLLVGRVGGERARAGGGVALSLRGEEGRRAWLVGALTSLSSLASAWTARAMDGRLWQALEIFLLPAIVLLQTAAPKRVRHLLGLVAREPLPVDRAMLVVGFVVGFAMLSLPPIGSGLLVALVKLPIEAVRLGILQSHLEPENVGGFLTASAITSAVISIVLGVVSPLVLPTEVSLPPLVHVPSSTLFKLILSAAATQVLLLVNLSSFTSPLTPSALLIPRNLILLCISSLGKQGIALRGVWVQMLYALPLATGAWLVYDDNLAQLWETLGRLRPGPVRTRNKLYDSNGPTADQIEGGKRRRRAALALVPFLPLLGYVLGSDPTAQRTPLCARLPSSVQRRFCPGVEAERDQTVHLVFAYYDEDLHDFDSHLASMRRLPFMEARDTRTFVYNKGPRPALEIIKAVDLGPRDRVVSLPNLGREGGTYLEHILAHYNTSLAVSEGKVSERAYLREEVYPLADYTFFLQPHFAWSWIAQERIEGVGQETGFAHFGPYMKNFCGTDGRGRGEYPFVKEIWGMFRGELCPPEGVLTAWSAQFVASGRRILANEYRLYERLRNMVEAPEGHWIHNNWGPNNSGGPSNPVFGHSLERAWPLIFGCTDPSIADKCPDDKYTREDCQCFDEVPSASTKSTKGTRREGAWAVAQAKSNR